jgi:hypothetical protein
MLDNVLKAKLYHFCECSRNTAAKRAKVVEMRNQCDKGPVRVQSGPTLAKDAMPQHIN